MRFLAAGFGGNRRVGAFALVQTGTVAAAGFCRCSGRGAGGKYHADTSGSADCRTGRSSQVSGLVFLPLSRQSAAVVCDGNPPAYRRTDKASAGTTDSIPAALGASAVSVFRKDVTFSAGCLFAGAAPCGSAGNSADSLRTRCRRHSSSVYPDGGLDIFTAASAASFGI